MPRFNYFLFSILMVFSIKGWSQPATDSIEIAYDPAQITIDADSGRQLLEKIQEQVLESKKSHETYFVPIAPPSIEALAPFSSLDRADMETFLAKKQKFLEKISHGIQWLRIPVSLHNKVMQTINAHFFAAAPTIARANSSGASLRFQVGAGLGLSSALAQRIEKVSGMSWFPKTGGLYIALGFGLAIHKTQNAGWTFEVFGDFDHLKSVKSFLATAGADVTVAYVAQDSSVQDRLKSINAEIMGPLGTLRLSDSHFSFGPGAGVTFPPLLDKAMFYSLQEKRIVFLSLNLTPIGEFFKGSFQRFSRAENGGGPLCQNVFY